MVYIILNVSQEEVATVCGQGVSLRLMEMCYHVAMINRDNIRLEIFLPHRLRISIIAKKQTAFERQFSESGPDLLFAIIANLKRLSAIALYLLY